MTPYFEGSGITLYHGDCREVAPRTRWTADEDATLRAAYSTMPTADIALALCRDVPSTYRRAYALGLRKSAAFLASTASGRLRKGDGRGASCRFPKGHAPANKGLRRPGWSAGRMRETQFRRGERSGVAVKLWKPIGTERVSKDGYLERKVNDDLPLQARWRSVHLIVWEAANGPLPRGHAVAFKNGDKRDIRLDNMECISRRELMARNTVHNLPPEVAGAIQLLGALNRQIRKRSQNA